MFASAGSCVLGFCGCILSELFSCSVFIGGKPFEGGGSDNDYCVSGGATCHPHSAQACGDCCSSYQGIIPSSFPRLEIFIINLCLNGLGPSFMLKWPLVIIKGSDCISLFLNVNDVFSTNLQHQFAYLTEPFL